jgi:hypothetical protein
MNIKTIKKSRFLDWIAMRSILMIAVFGFLAQAIAFGAQTKPPATFADYGKWETLASAGDYGGFSPDGRWLVYAINRSNRDNELRITKLADGTTKIAAFGTQPAFTSDSIRMLVRLLKRKMQRCTGTSCMITTTRPIS